MELVGVTSFLWKLNQSQSSVAPRVCDSAHLWLRILWVLLRRCYSTCATHTDLDLAKADGYRGGTSEAFNHGERDEVQQETWGDKRASENDNVWRSRQRHCDTRKTKEWEWDLQSSGLTACGVFAQEVIAVVSGCGFPALLDWPAVSSGCAVLLCY